MKKLVKVILFYKVKILLITIALLEVFLFYVDKTYKYEVKYYSYVKSLDGSDAQLTDSPDVMTFRSFYKMSEGELDQLVYSEAIKTYTASYVQITSVKENDKLILEF